MINFEVHILGCGSALPTTRHNQTSQVVDLRDKLYMIDCGEGTQLQMRKQKLKFARLNHIFISHLHGDHCFGLPGLISTMGMLGRTASLTIHAPKELESLLRPQLDFFCKGMAYEVIFNPIDTTTHALIYQDKSVSVYSIPLNHHTPCCGFLFRETQPDRHLIRDMIDFYKIPIAKLKDVRAGEDYITDEGVLVPNSRLTHSGGVARSYAYCSDTAYAEKIIPLIENVDLLFHESTFLETEKPRAKETAHSTAKDAATIALKASVGKLIIGHFSARYDNEALFEEEAQRIFIHTHAVHEGEAIMVLSKDADLHP